ncbi:hypothetical protein PGTUg99_030950 [Puccinia graminis f. sp. tritici]|uniref:Uncharacterized protein n=1 Tax=Puccinia graminis f. sp. tritici TaxID=56615 RepID=A0A5B0RP26_PUCGR|nr:hypothetical protein PGTUg99_030950 [Puccinia graminis f. sp. tritici]
MVGTSAGPEEGRKSPVYNKEEFPCLTGEGVQSQTRNSEYPEPEMYQVLDVHPRPDEWIAEKERADQFERFCLEEASQERLRSSTKVTESDSSVAE